MPTNAVTVTATYTNLPAPAINSWKVTSGTSISVTAQAYPNHAWVLQISSDLANWVNAQTNNSDNAGALQFSIPVNPAITAQFFRLKAP
jgi:hypothetical protein